MYTAAVARAYMGLPGDPVPDPGQADLMEGADVAQIRAVLSAFGAWEHFAAGRLDDVER